MLLKNNNPFTEPSFSLLHRLRRLLWNITYSIIFNMSPRPFHLWRAFILRLFGAKIGKGCHIYSGVKIWAPWNLVLGDYVGVADGVTLYSMDIITIGDYAVISQGANLCCGSHDYNSSNFQLVTKPISIGSHAWICAEAFIHSGVQVSTGVVVGACSVVVKDLTEPWSVYAGNPVVRVGERKKK